MLSKRKSKHNSGKGDLALQGHPFPSLVTRGMTAFTLYFHWKHTAHTEKLRRRFKGLLEEQVLIFFFLKKDGAMTI